MIAKKQLSQMIARDAIPQSLLFAGPKGAGKAEAALQFAGDIICLDDPEGKQRKKIASGNHPDIHFFRPEGKSSMHTIHSLRHLADEVALCPNEAPKQFFLIFDADRMLPSSSNALLKTLEEPTARTVIILTSSQPEKLLPTIASRCQKILFQASATKEKNSIQKELVMLLAKGMHFRDVEKLSSSLEEERKEWEKELRKELLAELTPVQRESLEKEIEGAVSLRYQERAFSLLETVFEWYRDITLVHLDLPQKLLFYPEYLEKFQTVTPIPLEKVEKVILQTRLALERSLRLSTCLETLFTQLAILN